MKMRSVFKIVLTLLMLVGIIPHFAITLLCSNGNHQILTENKNGVLKLVFHHDQDSKHDHSNSGNNSTDSHSSHSDDHKISISSIIIGNLTQLKIYLAPKIATALSALALLKVYNQASLIYTPFLKLHTTNSKNFDSPNLSFRKIILLI